MSCLLRFVPVESEVLPNAARTEAARILVEGTIQSPHRRVAVDRFDDGVRLIDSGENLQSIKCPSCGSELLDLTWLERLGEASTRAGVCDQRSAQPCCGAMLSLRDLHYDWPVGFARFCIDVWYPLDWFMGPELTAEERALLADLSTTLGTRVTAVLAHY